MNPSENNTRLAERIYDYFPKIEVPLVALALIGYQLKITKSSSFLMIIGMSILCICYYLLSISKKVKCTSTMENYIYKSGLISCSIGTLAVLYKLQHWLSAPLLLLISTTSLCIILLYILVRQPWRMENSCITTRLIIRVLAIVSINLVLLTTT